MTALPTEHDDPLDPARILADLPEDDQAFFRSQYEEHVIEARDPAGWGELRRFLRLWRFHADATHEPGYWEAREAARNGTGGGMPLEEVIRAYRSTS